MLEMFMEFFLAVSISATVILVLMMLAFIVSDLWRGK